MRGQLYACACACAPIAMGVTMIAFAACSSFEEGADSADGAPPEADGAGADVDIRESGADGRGTCGPAPKECATGTTSRVRLSFDDGTRGVLDEPQFDAQGTVTVDNADGVCGRGALHATANVPSGGSAKAAYAVTKLGTVSKLRIAFSFKGPSPGTDTFVALGCRLFFAESAGGDRGISVVMQKLPSNALRLVAYSEPGQGVQGTEQAAIVLDPVLTDNEASMWRSIDATLSIGGGGTTMTPEVLFDGASVGSVPTWIVAGPIASTEIRCGISYADKEQATHEVWIDDLLIESCQ